MEERLFNNSIAGRGLVKLSVRQTAEILSNNSIVGMGLENLTVI